ncbi:hypothetical protein LEMLEM_LOCUS54, partial [Lemmus lemmus]
REASPRGLLGAGLSSWLSCLTAVSPCLDSVSILAHSNPLLLPFSTSEPGWKSKTTPT